MDSRLVDFADEVSDSTPLETLSGLLVKELEIAELLGRD